jgi:hypothetical protein
VDYGSFHTLCQSHQDLSHDTLDRLAEAIHEVWRHGLTESQKPNENDKPFGQLALDVQESNRAAAERIPRVLALAGLELADGTAAANQETAVKAHIERHVDALAEGEHDGFMDERRNSGWRYAQIRDDAKRLHNCLRPYPELSRSDQEKDRKQVRSYPAFARLAGCRIVFTGRRR